MITFLSLYFWCRGQSAMAPMAVVQFGLAIRAAEGSLSPLISGTTRGTPSVMRQAEELSMTTVFLSPPPIFLPHSSEKSPETAMRMISHSWAASRVKGSIVMSPNLDFTTLPAALFAKSFTFFVGKLRVSRHLSISSPTAPEQPTMPTQSTPSACTATLLAERRACLPALRPARAPAASTAPAAAATGRPWGWVARTAWGRRCCWAPTTEVETAELGARLFCTNAGAVA
mmetsp:Transcript_76852/g.166314  ORF Transcript_76852/g.166314 Transcript_76852/m.166314 type:complete len:229 (+) Transcript_76852:682-1368(+)